MNDLIQQTQTWLEGVGAPAWLQQPSAWLMVACGVLFVLLLLRMVFKRRPQPVLSRRERDSNGGAFGSLTEAFASQIPESEKERTEFGQMLKQAGFYSRTARASVYAFRFLLMAFPLFVAGILAVFSPREQTFGILIGGGIVAALLSILPRLYVYFRKQSRLREISHGLADMLDMLSMCLSGGMPLTASLDHVSKNLTNYPALAFELQILKRQTEVGSLKNALRDMSNRLDMPEVRQVASLLTRGDQLGTSLSGSLLDQADHFRTSRKQLATLQSNRTPVLLTFPLMFCFAPAVLIILMSPAFMQLAEFFNPDSDTNPLAGNEKIGTSGIVNTLESLDQQATVDAQFTPGGIGAQARPRVGNDGVPPRRPATFVPGE